MEKREILGCMTVIFKYKPWCVY